MPNNRAISHANVLLSRTGNASPQNGVRLNALYSHQRRYRDKSENLRSQNPLASQGATDASDPNTIQSQQKDS